jgi:phosphate acyltransferase
VTSEARTELPIALDVAGGDTPPDPSVAAAVCAAGEGIAVALVGPRELMASAPANIARWPAGPSPDPGSPPWVAVRDLPRSSVRVGLEAVRDGRAAAFVSCGASGAILIEAVRTLGLLPGVSRPALAVSIPRAGAEPLLLLDAGANVDCRSEHLVGFARLGAAWARAHGREAPRLGLLSNGSEPRKGNEAIRAALERLLASGPVDVRQVEPHDALGGACDVLVADGLLGNVMLKSLEAAVDLVAAHAGALLPDAPTRDAVLDRVSWPRHGAALLLGVRGLVLIGHGRSDAAAVLGALRAADRARRAHAVAALAEALAPPA